MVLVDVLSLDCHVKIDHQTGTYSFPCGITLSREVGETDFGGHCDQAIVLAHRKYHKDKQPFAVVAVINGEVFIGTPGADSSADQE